MWRPLVFGLVVHGVFGMLAVSMMRWALPWWWQKARVRRAIKVTPVVGIAAMALWMLSMALGLGMLAYVAASVSAVIALTELALVLTLPLARALGRLGGGQRLDAQPAPEPSQEDEPSAQVVAQVPEQTAAAAPQPSPRPATDAPTARQAPPVAGLTRRQWIMQGAASAIPLTIGTTAVAGVAAGSELTSIRPMTFEWSDLPQELDGFKILHLSDIHIGFYIGLHQLEQLLERAEAHKPDLVLVTGDLSDDLDRLPDALNLISQLRAPHGAWASVGNHEYYRGIKRVLRSHERSEVPMLLDNATTLKIGGAKLCLAGADDPRRLRNDPGAFLSQTVQRSLRKRPEDAFTILMSHRPRGFDEAARQGVELTLAGHTHGGQLGWQGRSLLFPDQPERYMWGHFQKGQSQLYTSSGVGHWLPFRLGCPAEAPLITLSAQVPDATSDH